METNFAPLEYGIFAQRTSQPEWSLAVRKPSPKVLDPAQMTP
jgi:hypothetical protein